jgi:hypothetical protein
LCVVYVDNGDRKRAGAHRYWRGGWRIAGIDIGGFAASGQPA